MFARFLASQLRRPTGWFGRIVMTRMLNRGNAELIASTLAELELEADDRLLDIGFGGGGALLSASDVIRNGRLVGVDFSPDVVEQGKKALAKLIEDGRLELMAGDVASVPLPDETFTKIVTTNTIYFWPDPPAAAASLFRLLAPAGKLAIGFTGAEKMARYGAVTRNENGFRWWHPEEVEVLLREAGFVDVACVALEGKRTRGDFVACARR